MINDELLHKWINKTISETELEIFKARPEFESLNLLYQQTESLKGPNMDAEAMLEKILSTKKIESATMSNKPKTKKKIIPLWLKLTAAASIVLVGGLFLLSPKENTITLHGKEGFAEALPDGTFIELYPNSSMSYDETTFISNRLINMKGIASFHVTEGSPFKVKSTNGVVSVLGTSFHVYDIEDKFEVFCDHGKVKVEANNSASNAIIEAEESFTTYHQGGSILRKKDFTKLKVIELQTVIKEIEKRFDVKIELKDVDPNQKLTSGFQHDNVENAIKTVTLALDLSFNKIGDTFTVSK